MYTALPTRLALTITAFALALVSFSVKTEAADETLLLRQPDLHGTQVVFVYAGDIWTADIDDGIARKLTSHDGLELFPVFSPDGSEIAFSAEYSGTRQIWVMPSEGGEARQLTFYPDAGRMPPRGGWDNIPIDWTSDGSKVLFRSNRTPYGQRVSRYFLANADGAGLESPLEVPEGGPASLSPDGKRLAYSIKSREFRTWKRYKAGRAQDIFVYDLEDHTIDRLTTYPGTDHFPIWAGETIYFISDRSSVDSDEPRRLNFFKMHPDTGVITQVTDFEDFDCLWPQGSPDGIIFENGGALWILDTTTDTTRRLHIRVLDDRPHAQAFYASAADSIESFTLSPHGKRVFFGARGEVFSVPAEHGEIRNLSQTPAVRERLVDMSPDGQYLSYVSDQSGEYELYIEAYHEDGKAIQLTTGNDAWITGYSWSPDSRFISLTDTRHRLRVIDIASKTITEIDHGEWAPVRDSDWSADSAYLAYVKTAGNRITTIWVYSFEDDLARPVTNGRYDCFSPTFDPDGRFLYYLSSTEFDWRLRRFKNRVFLTTLQADLRSPFEAEEDEVEVAKPKGTEKEDDAEDEAAPEKKEIAFDGISERVVTVPIPSGDIAGIRAIENGLIFVRDNSLRIFDNDDQKEETVLEAFSGGAVSTDNKKLLFRSRKNWGIVDLKPNQKPGKGMLDLKEMTVEVDPKVEWRHIYNDAWRIMRDWFYDPGMHGVNWPSVRQQYAKLVPYIGHRADLDYLLGEMIGELNAGHTYVNSAPKTNTVERIEVGVLGCELEAVDGRYRITTIFDSRQPAIASSSPLRAPGLDVNEGDYILAIEDRPLTSADNPYRYLENRAGRKTTLLINTVPETEGAREVIVEPLASELDLRHDHWVEHNRRIVEELSQGRIGYIYVPDTSFDGFKEFYQGWYELANKEALIIDDRYNGGGQIPAPMIFDMAKPRLSYWSRRGLKLAPTPLISHEGPKLMLINGRSSSGGDAFPAYFKKMNLGPLMGSTTWGGLVGYSYSPRFVDGGGMAVPSFGYVNTDGEWDVEYVGVSPDIEVFDDPTLIRQGREPMLEEAVQYLLEQLGDQPAPAVVKPAGPDRS